MHDRYGVPDSLSRKNEDAVSKQKLWLFVVLSFIAGSVLSGFSSCKYLYDAFSDSIALSAIYSDMAYAERDLQLLMLSNGEFRCRLSKMVDRNVGSINGYNISPNPIADVEGILGEMEAYRLEVNDLYDKSSVWEYASKCSGL